MNKMYFILVLAVLVFGFSIAVAGEQPLARIAICDADGSNCQTADNGGHKEILACENIVLKSDSRDPLGWSLEEKWNATEEGKDKTDVFQGDALNFMRPRSGYVNVALNVSNNASFHETYIIMAVRENKIPEIEEIIVIVGLDKNETILEPNMHQAIQTVPEISVIIERIYKKRDDRDVLKPDIKADASIEILESKCEGSKCGAVFNFPKEGKFPIIFSDYNLCGESEPLIVEVQVSQNQPPSNVDIFGDFAGESSITLSGKDPEKSGSENKIVEYNWTVTDKNGKVIKNSVSESSEYSFSGEPGAYNATLCVKDRFGGTACSEPHSISILGLEILIADPTATSREAKIGQNITLDASLSKPLRFIKFFEWRMCYLDKGKCIDEKLLRSYNPAVNTTVPRSGEYEIKLRIYQDIYVGNKTADSSDFHINVKSAPEEKSASVENNPEEMPAIASMTVAVVNVTATSIKSLETPALGILPALLMLYLARFVKKEGEK